MNESVISIQRNYKAEQTKTFEDENKTAETFESVLEMFYRKLKQTGKSQWT